MIKVLEWDTCGPSWMLLSTSDTLSSNMNMLISRTKLRNSKHFILKPVESLQHFLYLYQLLFITHACTAYILM